MEFQVSQMSVAERPVDMPPMLWDDDTARTRVTDPVQSHMAADRSQATKKDVARRVLQIVADSWREMTGNEINVVYAERWPFTAHFDSPRKRSGELAAYGLLSARKEDRSGLPLRSALYSITAAGRKELDRG